MRTQCPKCSAVDDIAADASTIGKAVHCRTCVIAFACVAVVPMLLLARAWDKPASQTPQQISPEQQAAEVAQRRRERIAAAKARKTAPGGAARISASSSGLTRPPYLRPWNRPCSSDAVQSCLTTRK